MIARMQSADYLYVSTYAGFYCVGCEAYKGRDELVPAGEDTTATGEQGGRARVETEARRRRRGRCRRRAPSCAADRGRSRREGRARGR